MQEVKLLIGGDLVPTDSNKNLFESGDIRKLFGDELLNILQETSFKVFNLEVPLADKVSPIDKCGPNLIASTETINGIVKIGTDVLCLANNHIMDHGEFGLKSTIEILKKNKIQFLGVGDNLAYASKPFIVTLNNKKVGIYACAEHEFAIAGENSPGANPFDPMESIDHIVRLKEKCDYVIVLYHGGKEYYRYPSPILQKVCRKIIDKGADLIVCQHSHCIGCRENYKNGTIIYGQGNFLFDMSNSEFWQTSLLLEVSIGEGFFVKEIPLIKEKNCVRLAKGKDGENILRNYKNRSKQILQDGFIDSEYNKFVLSLFNNYLVSFLGGSLFLRILNRLCMRKLYQSMYSKHSLLALKNYVECEAHREIILRGLNNFINKK